MEDRMVSIMQKEYDRLYDKEDKKKQKNFSMIERFPGRDDITEHFLHKIIFDLRPAVCKVYYDLLIRRNPDTNEVDIFTKGMSFTERNTYNEKLRDLIHTGLIKRRTRYKVQINPQHWRPWKKDVANLFWEEK